MPEVIAVSFRRGGKPYYFDPEGTDYQTGQWVLAETNKGLELGQVVRENTAVPDAELKSSLRPIVRVATDEDRSTDEANRAKEADALEYCRGKVKEHKLPMRLVAASYTFDCKRLTVYFGAENRVDFRALVRDLASHFRTRIELHQLGVRDLARAVGGYGTCGQELCCRSWLPEFYPTAIKMAKEQGLSLNPSKVSGLCGRLLCCLRYEYETYVHLRKSAPRQGKTVDTEQGKAKIKDVSLLKGEALLELPDGRTEWRPYDEFVKAPLAQADDVQAEETEERAPEPATEEKPATEKGRRRASDKVGGRRRPRRKSRKGGQSGGKQDGGSQERSQAQDNQQPGSEGADKGKQSKDTKEGKKQGGSGDKKSKSGSRRRRRRRRKPSGGSQSDQNKKSDG
jgi:cell fate regulator YaaT (PSP1 superfamily)